MSVEKRASVRRERTALINEAPAPQGNVTSRLPESSF